jgi:DNA-directed RNA polymerase specialized sigma24 family protein
MRTTVKTFEYTNADHAAVRSASKQLLSRYRNYVSYDDVQQELYLWLFQNYRKADRWRETYEERHAERTLVKALRNAGERYCRAEKAHWDGYHVEDEQFYSLPMVADLLALYFDPEWMIPNGIDLNQRSGGKAPSEGGNLMAMVADVGKAYEHMPVHDQQLLKFVYSDPKPSNSIAVLSIEWDCSYSAANSRVRRVLGRLRAQLGGPDPYNEGSNEVSGGRRARRRD